MANLPPMKLSPEATPWGREIERIVTALEKSGGRADTNAAAAQQQMGTAAAALAEANAIRAAAARVPNPPINLVVLQVGEWDSNGAAKVSVTANWEKTTTGIDGGEIQIAGYEIWWSPAGVGNPVLLSAVQPNSFSRNGFTPQDSVTFRVRAVTKDNVYSQFSGPVTIDLVAPMTPLPQPSAPTLVTDRGIIAVKWDGKLGGSATLPQRFSYVYVTTSSTENGLYTPVAQTLAASGMVIVTTIPYGETAWFRLIAVDNLGITSSASAAASIVSTGIDLGTLDQDVADAIAEAQAAGAAGLAAAAAAELIAAEAATNAQSALDDVQNSITSSLDEYVVSTSSTVVPGVNAGWSSDTPDWVDGQYVWRRTKNTRLNGTITYSAPAVITGGSGETGEDAVLLRVSSTRGTSFKNNAIATVLTVTVFRGSQRITTIQDLHAVFGGSAYLEWWWRRMDDAAFGVISSADNRLSQSGFALTVSPADVDEQSVFECRLQTSN